MIGQSEITSHELTAASSAVAGLAIIGGYLGVRSADQNALKIAREERSRKPQDELSALRRAAYVKCLANLSDLMRDTHLLRAAKSASGENRFAALVRYTEALTLALNANAEAELLAPKSLYELVSQAYAHRGEVQSRHSVGLRCQGRQASHCNAAGPGRLRDPPPGGTGPPGRDQDQPSSGTARCRDLRGELAKPLR